MSSNLLTTIYPSTAFLRPSKVRFSLHGILTIHPIRPPLCHRLPFQKARSLSSISSLTTFILSFQLLQPCQPLRPALFVIIPLTTKLWSMRVTISLSALLCPCTNTFSIFERSVYHTYRSALSSGSCHNYLAGISTRYIRAKCQDKILPFSTTRAGFKFSSIFCILESSQVPQWVCSFLAMQANMFADGSVLSLHYASLFCATIQWLHTSSLITPYLCRLTRYKGSKAPFLSYDSGRLQDLYFLLYSHS